MSQTSALKVGLISDLHLNLHYDASIGNDENGKGDCIKGSGEPTNEHAPMGRYGCDAPTVLVENMLQAFLKKEGKQDVIFFSGNFAAHHVAENKNGLESEEMKELMFDSLSALTQLFAYYFPDTLVLPSFGNTDTTTIDNPVSDEEHAEFHEKIFNLWFETLPGNVKSLNTHQVD